MVYEKLRSQIYSDSFFIILFILKHNYIMNDVFIKEILLCIPEYSVN
jgi:hypothetical protein